MHFTPLNVSPRSCRRPRGQRGMALVFVLIMISIVFVIAAVSSRIVTLGERAARNDRDRQTAFQAAEAALSDAEIDIMGPNTSITARVAMFGTLPADEGCSNDTGTRGFCGPLETGAYKAIFQDESSDRRYANFGEFTDREDQFPVSTSGALPVKLPRYIIEKSAINYRNRASSAGRAFDAFIVTTIGYGLQPGTQVVLQAVISKPVPTN
jgi:type IV pilus assembly protein PilX